MIARLISFVARYFISVPRILSRWDSGIQTSFRRPSLSSKSLLHVVSFIITSTTRDQNFKLFGHNSVWANNHNLCWYLMRKSQHVLHYLQDYKYSPFVTGSCNMQEAESLGVNCREDSSFCNPVPACVVGRGSEFPSLVAGFVARRHFHNHIGLPIFHFSNHMSATHFSHPYMSNWNQWAYESHEPCFWVSCMSLYRASLRAF